MDCLVVGCGLSGAVVARFLAEEFDKKVVIWDKRNHIAGNMYDFKDEHGILVHKYGPHTFHTKEKHLYDYVCRFANWEEYKLNCMAHIDGKFTPTPFNFETIDEFYDKEQADKLKGAISKVFGNRKVATVLELLESDNVLVREYAQFLFDKDYSLYTSKQWGISANEVDPSILKRVPLRFSYDVGYFDDEYQVMPVNSYTEFFENILSHKNIKVELNKDALEYIKISDDNKIILNGEITDIPVIYTGALDELFGMKYGALPYRTLRFEWKYEDIDSFQPAPVVAYPQTKDYTRITEYKKLPYQNVKGTTFAVEYSLQYEPDKSMDPYYPLLTEDSINKHELYKKEAEKIENLFFCGRLANFKYYNMDQALKCSLSLCDELSHILS